MTRHAHVFIHTTVSGGKKGSSVMMRIGIGYDVHKLVEDRKLILGGIEIPHEKGLLGHSDADVLIHAVMDALLGAASLGDIGRHFPPSDDSYKGISSCILLEKVNALLRENGYTVGNIDCVIIAENPKLSPYIDEMREKMAKVIGVAVSQIAVKATTTEGLGFEGRKEGISAQAVCLLESRV